jgi:hypothetical protein
VKSDKIAQKGRGFSGKYDGNENLLCVKNNVNPKIIENNKWQKTTTLLPGEKFVKIKSRKDKELSG